MGDEHGSGAEPKSAQSQAWLLGRLVLVGGVLRHGVKGICDTQGEGEQAQPWRFCTTEIPELGRDTTEPALVK